MTRSISVIICTHNPSMEFLLQVLDGLRTQTLPISRWEMLLVDNSSEAPLADKLDIRWHPNARHVREDVLGLTSARLRGIKEAKGEVLVFVDDDTILSPNYLEEAVAIGTRWPFIGVWGGNIVPRFQTPVPNWIGSEIWRLTVETVKKDIWSNIREGFATIPSGAGMCVRCEVARHFAARSEVESQTRMLDRMGNLLSGYGDIDLAHCAFDMGLGTGKARKLSLTHLIPASRLTLDYFLRHAESDAASLCLFRAMRGLSVSKSKKTGFVGTFLLFQQLMKFKISPQHYAIQRAHQRGLRKGWILAQQFLQAKTHALSDYEAADGSNES